MNDPADVASTRVWATRRTSGWSSDSSTEPAQHQDGQWRESVRVAIGVDDGTIESSARPDVGEHLAPRLTSSSPVGSARATSRSSRSSICAETADVGGCAS